MSQWGSTSEKKPLFPWLVSGGGTTVNNQNKVYATNSGWVYQWPWAEEILVGIGGLANQMGAPNCVAVEAVTTELTNTNPESVSFRLIYNEKLIVTGSTPSILAIGSAPAANVTLVYNETLSEPLYGRVVFSNTTVNFSTYGGGSLTVNATSGAANFTNFASITDFYQGTSVGNVIAGSNTEVIASDSATSSSASLSKSPSASASPSASPSVTPSASPSPTASASKSPSASVSLSASASVSPSSSLSTSVSSSASRSASPSSSASLSTSPSTSTSPSASASASNSPSPSPSASKSPSASVSQTASLSKSPSASASGSASASTSPSTSTSPSASPSPTTST